MDHRPTGDGGVQYVNQVSKCRNALYTALRVLVTGHRHIMVGWQTGNTTLRVLVTGQRLLETALRALVTGRRHITDRLVGIQAIHIDKEYIDGA